MADIFLSYARADQPRVEKLAEALEEAGYTLWWDRYIDGGNQFSKDIEKQIAAAKVVIVAWSDRSVDSEWVRDEAAIARDDDKLLPIALDSAAPPIGFRQRQAIDFSSWPDDNAGLLALQSSLDMRLNETHLAPEKRSARRIPNRLALLASLFAIIVTAIAIWWAVDPAGPRQAIFGSERQDKLGVAILPFSTSEGGESELDGTRISGQVTDALSVLPKLRLSSSLAASAAMASSADPRDIAKTLDVSYLISGDLEVSRDTLRARIQLIDGQSGQQIWSREATAPNQQRDILVARLVNQLAQVLQARLNFTHGASPEAVSENEAALSEYRAGVEQMFGTDGPINLVNAYGHFRQAALADPGFADAHAAKAFVMSELGPANLNMTESVFQDEKAKALADALRLDGDNRLGRIAEAKVQLWYLGKPDRAIEILTALREEHPDDHLAAQGLGQALLGAGEFRASLDAFRAARRINPFDPYTKYFESFANIAVGDLHTVRRDALACRVDCGDLAANWARAIFALVRPEDFETEMAAMDDWIDAVSWPDDHAQTVREYVDWFRRVTRAAVLETPPPAEDFERQDMYVMMVAARTGYPDIAFAKFEQYLGRTSAFGIVGLLLDNRHSFPPELRADPRYRAIIENSASAPMLEFREAKGVKPGLPLDPNEIEVEKQRLAKLRR